MPSQILKQGLQSNTFLGVSKCLNPWPRLYNGPYDENRNAPKTPDEIHRYWDALMFCPVQNPWVDAEILLAIAHPEVFLIPLCLCTKKKSENECLVILPPHFAARRSCTSQAKPGQSSFLATSAHRDEMA